MRSLNKGAHPQSSDGTLVNFARHKDAAPYLIDKIGKFCSYCERHIPSNLAVEHVVAKLHAPQLERDWNNLLLACGNCNSHKGTKTQQRTDSLWPDEDDTFNAFVYSATGSITVSEHLDDVQKSRAFMLLKTTGLDKTLDKTSSADDRAKDRRERWEKALVAKRLLAQNQSITSAQQLLSLMVTDSYSVWMAVFQDAPDFHAAIQNKFPGTKNN